jgi:plastocyanin
MSDKARAYMRRLTALLAILAAVALLAGCGGGSAPAGTSSAPAATTGATGGSGAPAAASVTISEANFAFDPATVTVKVGDTITFTNNDSAPHIVKIDGQDLGSQAPGASVTWTATKAGSFPFVCTIHPNMTGTVTVQ